ncbi:MBL fold metallo-hydrolase [bacterium]|nr:MBL fold metallo-hydrolase [bacterium]
MFRQFGATPAGERLQRLHTSPLYNGKSLQNPSSFGSDEMGSFLTMLKEMLLGREQRTPLTPVQTAEFDTHAFAERDSNGVRIVWIGHSTVLIEMDGFRILTDPVFSKRCSPTSLMGPVRFHEVNIPDDLLRTLDVVLISHDHFDHLDMPTIEKLAELDVPFVVPLGVGAHLESWGVPTTRIREHVWWETASFAEGALEFVCTPARHFSGRGFTRNQTLWASWVIRTNARSIYFSGDSGYFEGFKEIGEKFGPFELTMIEMAAYHEELWPSVHMWPEQAVQAHMDLRGEMMLPIHWGTFNLAFHAWDEPAERLLKAAAAADVRVATPRPGQLMYVEYGPITEPWWREAK